MSEAPHAAAVAAAELVAAMSPCQKSRRGVVAFSTGARGSVAIYGEGFNGPALGACDGSEACRKDCGRRCVHAEMRAIRGVLDACDLVHVKIGADGRVVAGGGPSCWQCSREILDGKLVIGVWLYEAGVSRCTGCRRFEDSSAEIEDRLRRCMECGSDLVRDDMWRYRTAEEFHRETLRACAIGGPL